MRKPRRQCVCVYTYMYECIDLHTYTSIYITKCIYIIMYMYIPTYLLTYLPTYLRTCMHTCMHTLACFLLLQEVEFPRTEMLLAQEECGTQNRARPCSELRRSPECQWPLPSFESLGVCKEVMEAAGTA